MDEIRYIEGSPFFLNQGGNPNALDPVLNCLYTLVTVRGYPKESPEFVYYLDRISEEMVVSWGSSIGPNPMAILPYKLVGSPENNTEFPDEDYRFYIFYILCQLHHELDDYEGMRKLIERYESDFREQPYYGKLKALSLIDSNESKTLSIAITEAFDSSQNFPKYPELHKILAETIAVALEEGAQYIGSNPHIPKDDQEILELGKRKIARALEEENYPVEYLMVKSRLEILNKEFDKAKESISEARSELSRTRTRYTELRAEIGQIKNRIESQRQQSELEEKTTELSRSIDEIEAKVEEAEETLNDLNASLDNIRQEFQRTFLEFLGFFSAILAVIVITGQIAIEVADPQEAGRLMIVSYGGLLFAFGGFAAILSSTWPKRFARGTIALVGFLTAVSLVYPDAIRQLFIGIL